MGYGKKLTTKERNEVEAAVRACLREEREDLEKMNVKKLEKLMISVRSAMENTGEERFHKAYEVIHGEWFSRLSEGRIVHKMRRFRNRAMCPA